MGSNGQVGGMMKHCKRTGVVIGRKGNPGIITWIYTISSQ